MRAKPVVAAFCLFALLVSGSVASAEQTTWGKIKDQYHGTDSDHARLGPGMETNTIIDCDDCGGGGGGENPNYFGQPRSLPYGPYITETQVLTAGRDMAAAQYAVSAYLARGYIRRMDLDRAKVTAQGALAFLAFELPGAAVEDKQPIVIIHTFSAGATYATQVSAGIVRQDSNNVLHMDDDPSDPSVVISSEIVGANVTWATPTLDGRNDVAAVWSSVYDLKAGAFPSEATWQFTTGHSPCYWQNTGAELAMVGMAVTTRGATSGAIWLLSTVMNIHLTGQFGPGTNCP